VGEVLFVLVLANFGEVLFVLVLTNFCEVLFVLLKLTLVRFCLCFFQKNQLW
jgi:hypothetical protein